MAFKITKTSSISKFLAGLNDIHDKSGWIFRGVANSQHDLIPSIARLRDNGGIVQLPAITQNDERLALQRFRDQVRPMMAVSIGNDLEWMIVAQHHGLPTRLLDWTRSPLIAAYFASNTGTDEGAIYAVRAPQEVGLRDYRKPFSAVKVKLIVPPHVSDRVQQQSGLFTIHPDPNVPWVPDDEAHKFLVPPQYKWNMRRALDHIGVNEKTLFPGIDSTARDIAWRLRMNLPL